MCLTLTKDSARLKRNLRRRKRPITAWKLLDPNMESIHNDFTWKKGKNVSNRSTTNLDREEITGRRVSRGFHLFLKKPKGCPYPYPCRHRYRYPCRCPYRYQYRCPSENPANILIKCEIDPEDVVAVGKWEDMDCIVAVKATMIEGGNNGTSSRTEKDGNPERK